MFTPECQLSKLRKAPDLRYGVEAFYRVPRETEHLQIDQPRDIFNPFDLIVLQIELSEAANLVQAVNPSDLILIHADSLNQNTLWEVSDLSNLIFTKIYML